MDGVGFSGILFTTRLVSLEIFIGAGTLGLSFLLWASGGHFCAQSNRLSSGFYRFFNEIPTVILIIVVILVVVKP